MLDSVPDFMMDDVDYMSAEEPEVFGDGEETLVRIADILRIKDENKRMIRVVLDTPEKPLAKDINEFLSYPEEKDRPKQKQAKLFHLRQFDEAFGITDKGLRNNPASWIDLTARVKLSMKDDDNYGQQNAIKEYLVAAPA